MTRNPLKRYAMLGVASICLFLAMPAGAAVCGDLEPDPGEACDDGNTAPGDGCDATCQIEVGFDCSDAVPGALTGNPPIPSSCVQQICGDSIQSSNEICDDGNSTNGDGCSATCTVEAGFACTAATNWLDDIFSSDDPVPSFCQPASTVTVIKNTSGGDGTFEFTGTGPEGFTFGGGFSVSTVGGTDNAQFSNLLSGSYSLAETPQAGWSVVSATCVDDGGQPVDVPGQQPGELSFSLAAGSNVACTFNNAKSGSVNIIKHTLGGDGVFGFSTTLPDGQPTFTLSTSAGTSVAESRTVPAGTYVVDEDVIPPGWQFTSLECTENGFEDSTILGTEAIINVQDGETVNCTYINSLPVVDADGDGVNDDHDYCPDTTIPERVPKRSLGVNRFALVDGDYAFDTRSPRGKGPRRSYSTTDTAGCSCAQIIAAQGLGKGHTKYGCSISAMDDWVELVTP